MALPTPTVAAPIVQGRVRRGTGHWIWVPSIAVISAPTSVEITAGTDYTSQIADVQGFAPAVNTVPFGNAGSLIIPNVPGDTTLGDGTMMFNLSNVPATTDARTVFVDNVSGAAPTTGFWVDAPNGLVTSAKIKVYAATVMVATPSTPLDAVLTLTVTFSLQAASGFLTVPIV